MTEKHVALHRDPLPAVFLTVSAQPILFGLPRTGFVRRWNIGDRYENTLLLPQRQRFERPQNTLFEDCFHLSHHV
jgi:hypothetical protein